jgi:hypothetical protein
MEKSHGGDKDNCLSLTAHTIRARLNLPYGGYDFDDFTSKFFENHKATEMQCQPVQNMVQLIIETA